MMRRSLRSQMMTLGWECHLRRGVDDDEDDGGDDVNLVTVRVGGPEIGNH